MISWYFRDFYNKHYIYLETRSKSRLILTRDEDVKTHPRFALSRITSPSTAPSTTNAFIEQYTEQSIQPVTRLIEHQIAGATWCGTSFKVHPPATDEKINNISATLRRICLTVLQLYVINRSNINNYCELDEGMRCHSRSSAYLVQ